MRSFFNWWDWRKLLSHEFKSEIELHIWRKSLHVRSTILALHAFLNSHGIIQIWGRLRNSSFNIDKRPSSLFSWKRSLTKLILRDIHLKSCHCGPQQFLLLLREKYWSIHGKNLAKHVTQDCVLSWGVDYVGSFVLKDRRGKGSKTYQGYVSHFIYRNTQSIHPELASNLSTQTFILALKMFISRWWKPNQIISENWTNFVTCRRYSVEIHSKLLTSFRRRFSNYFDLNRWNTILMNLNTILQFLQI